MAFILFEDSTHFDLLPFTYTRPVYDLRAGILTFRERWEKVLKEHPIGYAYDYLRHINPEPIDPEPATWINGKVIPNDDLLRLIHDCEPDTYWASGEEVWVAHFSREKIPIDHTGLISSSFLDSLGLKGQEFSFGNTDKPGTDDISSGIAIRKRKDIFQRNEALIALDFNLLTQQATSEKIKDPYTRIYGADNLFVSPGVNVKAAIINAEDGPIYLGKNVTLSEGAIIKGIHGFCDNSFVAVGGKMRGGTTLGPFAKAGGEVSNSVFMGYSNKSHEGYMGNSVLGYWCNLGAGTNTSNLKNNYTEIKSWDYQTETFEGMGAIFCGLAMGDHSKCGIDTMLNSGTVIGVSANVFGGGYQPKFIPSFSWGGSEGMTTFQIEKAFEVAKTVMARRQLVLSESERQILEKTFALSAKFRSF